MFTTKFQTRERKILRNVGFQNLTDKCHICHLKIKSVSSDFIEFVPEKAKYPHLQEMSCECPEDILMS